MRIDFLSGLDQLPTQRKARGSAHGRAKLNKVAVQKIRDMAFNCKGGTSVKVLAGVFGISTSHVYAILAGDKWEWLNDGRIEGASKGRLVRRGAGEDEPQDR
jgi:hypothetical protein